MALVLNSDTYISVTDTATYLDNYHLSTEVNMELWAALSAEEKDVLIRRAARIIDRQPLIGLRATYTQTMEFPRAIYTARSGLTTTAHFWYGENAYITPTVPEEVKQAQCEIALSLVSGDSERQTMQREGVRSFTLGKLQETFVGAANNDLLPLEAKRLLSPYMGGGVAIV